MDEDSIDIENLLSTLDSQGMAGFTQAFFTDFEKGMNAVTQEHLPWLSELQKQTWNGVRIKYERDELPMNIDGVHTDDDTDDGIDINNL